MLSSAPSNLATPPRRPRALASSKRRAKPPTYPKPQVLWDGERVTAEHYGSDHWRAFQEIAFATATAGVIVVPLPERTHWSAGPTITRYAEIHGHTGWDVLEDLAGSGHIILSAGLLAEMTDLGRATFRHLRAHQSAGGNYASFHPGQLAAREAA